MGRRLKSKVLVSQGWRPAIRSPARHKEGVHGWPCLSSNPSKLTSLILLLSLHFTKPFKRHADFNPTAGRVAEWTEGELQNSGAN